MQMFDLIAQIDSINSQMWFGYIPWNFQLRYRFITKKLWNLNWFNYKS